MGFKEWLYDQLICDEVIDSEEIGRDDMSENTLLCETELEVSDIANYMNEYDQWCKSEGIKPEHDLPEF